MDRASSPAGRQTGKMSYGNNYKPSVTSSSPLVDVPSGSTRLWMLTTARFAALAKPMVKTFNPLALATFLAGLQLQAYVSACAT